MRSVAFISSTILSLFLATVHATAGDRTLLGSSWLHLNDWIGDDGDRWQSAGVSGSWMVGPDGTVTLPDSFGTLLELRTRAQIITPDDIANPAAWDRPAAGVVTTTVHSHFTSGGTEFALGAGVAFTGPQTGMLSLQSAVHDLLGDPQLAPAARAGQIGNAVYPTAMAEAGRRFRLADNIVLRPFAEAQVGVESFARLGGDLLIGEAFDRGVLVRDATTGLLYQTLEGETEPGMGFLFGADAAKVFHSALLPASDGYTLTPFQTRVRGGLLTQGDHLSVFYGVSWLSPEFTAQPSGQTVGAFQIQLNF